MLRAMKAFTEDTYSVSRAVYRAILGDAERETRLNTVRPIPQDLNVAGLPTLNPSQLEAIRHVLDLPVGLIQGPPGTGKTTTCAALVYHMRQTYDAQVLCAATSNVAVDHLATRIAKTGLKVVRVFAKSREDLPSDAADLGLHTLVRQKIERESPNGDLAKLMRLRAAEGNLLAEDYQRYKKLLSDVEIEILAQADVICATCIGSGDPRLLSFRFKHALIDEATQSIEPECLIPIVTGTKQIILVGDHCQLGPVVKSRNAEIAGLGRSLFERLVLLETHPPIRL
jgi:regulator of nonsense transcripts 1